MRFNQMPMIWKVLSLLLSLSAVSVVAVAFASAQMLYITHAYDDALRGPARANVALSRAGRHAVWTSRSILKLITAQSPQAREAAEKDVQSGRASFNTEISTAIATMPNRKAEFEALRTSYDGILNSTCFQTVNLAKSGEAGAVTHMNEHCGPELLTVITSLSKMVDETIVANETLVERLQAQADRAVAITVGAVLGGLVLVMGVAFWLTRSGIVAPLKALTETMVSMSKGHLSIKVPGQGRSDELGAMAQTVEVFRKGLEETERLRAAAAEAEKANEVRLRQERNAIADEFQTRMGSLAEAFVKSSGEVSGAAQSLAATAEETSRQAQVVSGAAEEAAVSVQTAAAATEEMTASIREINEQVVKAANVAAEASDEAAHTETEIRALNDAAQQIGEVVNLINDIASQTNLLALNATIEAARAGEAGKGFAVVASEVKQLATQTARATQDIGNKVTEIQSATDRTVGSIEKIVTTIADIRAISANVAAAVEEQGAATSEIAGNTARAADGTVQVTENIFGVGRAAEMTGAASTQLMGLSGNLSQSANDLEQEVKNFVAQLRSA